MSSTDITITLPVSEVAELVEALLWLRDWFSYDPATLAASMRRHSFGLFNLAELNADLARFIYLLGGDDQ